MYARWVDCRYSLSDNCISQLLVHSRILELVVLGVGQAAPSLPEVVRHEVRAEEKSTGLQRHGFHKAATATWMSLFDGQERECTACNTRSREEASETSFGVIDTKLICISKEFNVILNFLNLVLA